MAAISDENVKAMTEKSAEVCNGLVVVEGAQLVVSELRKHMDGDLPALLKIFCQGGNSSASVGCIGSIMKSLAASRAKKLIQPLQAEVSGASQSLSELSETLPAQMEAAASAKKAVEELPQKLNRFKEVPQKLKEALAKADPAPVEEILKELRCDELLTALRKESKLLAEFLVNAAATQEQLSRFSNPKWIRRIVRELNPVSCCGFSSHLAGEIKTLTEKLSKVGELSGRINDLLGSVHQVDEGLRELIRVLEEQLSVISSTEEEIQSIKRTSSFIVQTETSFMNAVFAGDGRYDFGLGVGKCSVCNKFCQNRGVKDTGRVYCSKCYKTMETMVSADQLNYQIA
jgi:DNA repair exonuclease SbcCD ATPase subunit